MPDKQGSKSGIKTHEFLALIILPFIILASLQTLPSWFFSNSTGQYNSPLVNVLVLASRRQGAYVGQMNWPKLAIANV
jgi:hypothetical protein